MWIATPIILVISLLFMIGIGVFLIKATLPFIMKEKLNVIAQKYMFVIEKFGYLTVEEKELMLEELEKKGFDIHNISIVAPDEKLSYGEFIEFSVTYKFKMKMPSFFQNNSSTDDHNIMIAVRKNSYSKIE